jgi:predicted acetyltransferase
LFEESLNDGNEMNEDGIFKYKYFDKYFNDDNYNAFFIRQEKTNKLLGFVMVNNYTKQNKGYSIAEFLVIPKFRKHGVGKQAAHKCFDLHKGYWEVSPSFGSDSAYHFWKKVINDYTHGNENFTDGTFAFNN